MNIDQIIDQIYVLPEKSKIDLKENIVQISLPKSSIILKANKIESNVYFIKSGVVRAFTNYEDNEITFWFGKEGNTVVSMKSYVENKKGYEDIELLEDCVLYKIETKQLKTLFDNDLHIANWGRRLAEQELIKTEERLISRQLKTASARYQELLNKHPYLIKRVQLGHIASYLGITQVSLSRIRANIK